MSPTSKPGQPIFGALSARRSSERTSSGWPQLRLRDSRITCQVLPLIGSAIAAGKAAACSRSRSTRACKGAGVGLRPNSSRAGSLRIVRIGQRRQRLGIDAAPVLRLAGQQNATAVNSDVNPTAVILMLPIYRAAALLSAALQGAHDGTVQGFEVADMRDRAGRACGSCSDGRRGARRRLMVASTRPAQRMAVIVDGEDASITGLFRPASQADRRPAHTGRSGSSGPGIRACSTMRRCPIRSSSTGITPSTAPTRSQAWPPRLEGLRAAASGQCRGAVRAGAEAGCRSHAHRDRFGFRWPPRPAQAALARANCAGSRSRRRLNLSPRAARPSH